jgi:hypothetical protein
MNHAIRGNQRPSEAIRGAHHEPSGAHQLQSSTAIMNHQEHTGAQRFTAAIHTYRVHERTALMPIQRERAHQVVVGPRIHL